MRSKRSYWSELYESFRRIFGWPVAFLGIISAVVLWSISPAATIGVKIVVPIGVMAYIVLATTIDLSISTFARSSMALPKILAATNAPTHLDGGVAILLLEKTDLLNHDAVVSIYIKQDRFEILFGIGYVLTVQEDGTVQILVTRVEPSQQGKADGIVQNNGTLLASLIVKPTLPRSYYSLDG